MKNVSGGYYELGKSHLSSNTDIGQQEHITFSSQKMEFGYWIKIALMRKLPIPPYQFILQSWKDLLPRFRIFSQPANSKVLPVILANLTKDSQSLPRIKF